MSHSLIGADRRSHLKILGVALAGAIGLVMFGSAAERANSTTDPRAQGAPSLIKAGGPAISARADVTILR